MSSHCHPAPTDPHSPVTRKETEAERWEPTWIRVLLNLQFHGARFAAEVSSSPPKPLALAGSPHTGAPRRTPLGPCQGDAWLWGCKEGSFTPPFHLSTFAVTTGLF